MRAEPTGRGTYTVESHGENFHVDVLCHQGNGCCSCFHFIRRIKPDIELAKADGTFHPHKKFKCPHLEFIDFLEIHESRMFLIKKYGESEPI